MIPENVALEDIDIWFQDEARVGQRGTVTRIWAKKGTRPRLTRQQQFEYAYIFGAVCPRTGQAAGLVLPYANTYGMKLHLEEISKEIPKGRHGILILDQAAWHTTKRLNTPKNITLLPLPPASPELNPVEQIWQVLRDHHLANRCFENYDAIVDASCNAWNWFVNLPNRVTQLCSRKWAVL